MKPNFLTDFVGLTNPYNKDDDQDVKIIAKKPQTEEEKEPAKPRTKLEVFYEWSAQSRSSKNPLNEKTVKIFLIMGVFVGIFLLLLQQFLIMIVILSLVFLMHMLSKLEPDRATYKITNFGVKYDDNMYEWQDLKHFFYVEVDETPTIAIDQKRGLPARIFLTVPDEHRAEVTRILDNYLVQLPGEPKTVVDKAYESVVGKIDLEDKDKASRLTKPTQTQNNLENINEKKDKTATAIEEKILEEFKEPKKE